MNWKALLYALESRKNSKFLIPRALKGGRFFFFFFFFEKEQVQTGSQGWGFSLAQKLRALEQSWLNLQDLLLAGSSGHLSGRKPWASSSSHLLLRFTSLLWPHLSFRAYLPSSCVLQTLSASQPELCPM